MIENKYSYKPTGYRPTFSTSVFIKCHIWVARAEANLAFRQSSFSPDIVLEKKSVNIFKISFLCKSQFGGFGMSGNCLLYQLHGLFKGLAFTNMPFLNNSTL